MNRKVTKMSTVTPMSTLTKSKPVGQGVKNIGNDLKKLKKTAMESRTKKTKTSIFDDPYVKSRMTEPSFEGMPQLMRKAVKTGTIMPTQQKPKAKMLPEVKVTAPSKLKRFVSKLTSTKRG